MEFEEGLFHCPRCSNKYDLQHNDIVGVEDEDGFSEIICEPCAKMFNYKEVKA